MSQKASPPIPQASPKTTASTAFVAIAASTALPPARRIPRPAAVARWWGATTAPLPPRARGAGTSGRGSLHAADCRCRAGAPPAGRAPAAYPAPDGSLAVGRHPRDVHPPLQHGPDRRHARLLPRRPAGVRRPAGRRDRAGPLHGLVLRGRAALLALLRHAGRSLRLSPDHGAGPGLRGRRGRAHRDHDEPRPPRRDALAGGRLDGGQRARDPGLRGGRHGRRRGAARPGRGPLRGGDPGRARRGHRGRGRRLHGARQRRLLRQRPPLRRLVVHLPLRDQRPARGSRRPRARAPDHASRATGRSCAAPTSGSWRPPGSPSTRSSGCGRRSRSSS